MTKGYMFYDDETANRQQLICELAYTLTDFDGRQIDEPVVQRINPGEKFDWYNIRINHIRAKDVADCPTMEQFCGNSNFLQDLSDYIFVAHGAKSSDLHHIEKSLSKYGIPFPEVAFVDTQEMACEILPVGKRSLPKVCEHYKIPFEECHESLRDAEACRWVFFKMVADGVDVSPSELEHYDLQASAKPKRKRRKAAPVLGQGRLNDTSKTVDEALAEIEAIGLRGDLGSIVNFEGLTVVLSGSVPGYSNRDILAEELRKRGAKPINGYVPKTAKLLVIGHNASQSRIDDAIARGIFVITAGELLDVMNSIDRGKENNEPPKPKALTSREPRRAGIANDTEITNTQSKANSRIYEAPERRAEAPKAMPSPASGSFSSLRMPVNCGRKILESNGVGEVEGLIGMSEPDLLRLRGFGTKKLDNLREFLLQRGILPRGGNFPLSKEDYLAWSERYKDKQ